MKSCYDNLGTKWLFCTMRHWLCVPRPSLEPTMNYQVCRGWHKRMKYSVLLFKGNLKGWVKPSPIPTPPLPLFRNMKFLTAELFTDQLFIHSWLRIQLLGQPKIREYHNRQENRHKFLASSNLPGDPGGLHPGSPAPIVKQEWVSGLESVL